MSAATLQQVEQLLARARQYELEASAQSQRALQLSALRAWQTQRLLRTYDDLRSERRYAGAVEFFFSDLYGPKDLSERDRQLARAWSHFRRALPEALLQVLAQAVELQVLTAQLDLAVVDALPVGKLSATTYATAYRVVGGRDQRRRQIELIVGVGEVLDRAVRRAWVGLALRAAHAPAHAAGFGVLQDFLERGLAAFREMNGAQRLLGCIRERELQLMEALLSSDPRALPLLGTENEP